MLAQSAHRTLDAAEADYFYVPTYVRCLTSFICKLAGRLGRVARRVTSLLYRKQHLSLPKPVQMPPTSLSSMEGLLRREHMLLQTCETAVRPAASWRLRMGRAVTRHPSQECGHTSGWGPTAAAQVDRGAPLAFDPLAVLE